MKNTICLVVLAASVLTTSAFADSAKLVLSCQQNETLGQNAYSLEVLEVFQEPGGNYQYFASVTPANQDGTATGPASYASSGALVSDSGALASADGSIRMSPTCGQMYVFSDQSKNLDISFSRSLSGPCQFNN